MKIRHLALAAMAVAAGQAYALTPAATAAATLKVFVSGASASKAIIGGLFTQNCNADLDTYQSQSGSAAGTGDTANGASYNIYSCTMKAGNDFGLATGTSVAFHKRDRGGSGFGVAPVAKNTPIDFMDIATCNATTKLCTGVISKAPDGGTSDVEPSLFHATLNVPAGFESVTYTNSDFQSIAPLFQTVMGLAVSGPLYTALQTAQATTGRPSIPFVVASSLVRSGFDYSLGWGALNVANPDNQVNICRRENGSGTQAAANLFYGQYPSNSIVPVEPGVNADSSVGSVANNAGEYHVRENSSSGNVRTCLSTAGVYAIGHLSLESNDAATTWKFVKIDGANPSRDDAKAGKYPYWVESTLQINKAAPAAVKSFLAKFATEAGKPDNLASLSSDAQGGVMALPTSPGCPATFGTGTANQVKFCSRVTRDGNNANPAYLYK